MKPNCFTQKNNFTFRRNTVNSNTFVDIIFFQQSNQKETPITMRNYFYLLMNFYILQEYIFNPYDKNEI